MDKRYIYFFFFNFIKMSYLLYFKNNVYGCYGKIELLRANILIIIFRLLEKSQINSTKYENIVDYLTVPDFTVENFLS